MTRKILRVLGDTVSVAAESRFDSEERLRSAVAAHPEVLPSEDIGLGPLITLGIEVDFGSGPIDLLAVDPTGRLVIAEFKRGSENPDVRKVVAQVLDYGSSVWRTSVEQLEALCVRSRWGPQVAIVNHVEERLSKLGDDVFDPDAFRTGLAACLDTGTFVFLYVGRDLDDRTRRIMTYLAEGPRMSFFAVEVDYYRGADDEMNVLVPRTAFLPSWIKEPSVRQPTGTTASLQSKLADAPAGTVELMERLDLVAAVLHVEVTDTRTGRHYHPSGQRYGLGVYTTQRGVEFNLEALRKGGQDAWADTLADRMGNLIGRRVTARMWPTIPVDLVLAKWDAWRTDVINPFFQALSSIPPQPEQH
jgi:hypothetical protein